jgi:TolA-binding protein
LLVLSLFLTAFAAPVSAQKADPAMGTARATGEEDKAGIKGSAGPHESRESMETYKKELQEDLRELDKKISVLAEKMKKRGARLQAEAKESWNELRAKEKTARARLKDLSSSSREAWEKAKSEAGAAMDEVRKAYDRAASYFKS